MDSQKIVKDLLNEFKESDLTEFEMETAELRLGFPAMPLHRQQAPRRP